MKKNNKLLISVPYIYPVCPLSIDHAKIMLVADINARIARAEGKDVCFPIASHYSGVTAENTINNLNSNNKEVRNKERDKFIKGYKTPRKVVENFNNPEKLLDYYTAQILLDLKRLDISCDYVNFYKTNEEDYEIFVRTIFNCYEKKGMLIKNSKDELALNYDDETWKKQTKNNLEQLIFISPSLRNNIISSFENIRSDWGILRNYGIGVRYRDNYVIDPMFDSELFVIYDLYKKFKYLNNDEKKEDIFNEIFEVLGGNKKTTIPIVEAIVKWLPTDLFVCEEHLKNWIIKKTFSESLLFKKKYYTNKYFITGMGYVNGERMSSSRGTAVLLKDLLDEYGSNVARMIIMFTGGHPSKMYNYTEENIKIINKMLKEFYDYVVFLNSQLLNVECNNNDFVEEFDKIYQELKDGFYQQVLVDVMKNLKKKYSNAEMEILIKVRNTLKYFMNILLPNIKI